MVLSAPIMRGEGRLAPPPCRCPFHHGGEGTWCLSWPLCFPTAAAGLHKALGFNLIYQLLPDDLIYPPLCQSLPKSLTCAQSRPTFPTTDLMSHTCPRPSLSEDNSPSSPNLTIHPPPQPGPGLMNSHNHTLIQSHTHTHTQLDQAPHARSRYRGCPFLTLQSPQLWLEGEAHSRCGHCLHKLANLGLIDQRSQFFWDQGSFMLGGLHQ